MVAVPRRLRVMVGSITALTAFLVFSTGIRERGKE